MNVSLAEVSRLGDDTFWSGQTKPAGSAESGRYHCTPPLAQSQIHTVHFVKCTRNFNVGQILHMLVNELEAK